MLMRRYEPDTTAFLKLRKKLLNTQEKLFNFCIACNVPFFDCELFHKHHICKLNIPMEMFKNPTEFLTPLDDNKSQAQFFFDTKSLKFFTKCFMDLKITKVICMGAPRLHEYICNNYNGKIKSFLLDFDYRFFYFYDDDFAWYNMCNNHFFDNNQKENFLKFLKIGKSERLVIFTDPPFGCRTEPIVYTIQELKKMWSKTNKLSYRPLPVFWIFPYFSEPKIIQYMPEMEMCDYKISYTNHIVFQDTGPKVRKLGSPVRLFTNVPLELLQLPVKEGYKYCEKCRKYTALENFHCNMCKCCPSKNGSTYIHCNICKKCVKPSYVHCSSCRRCVQVEGHNCEFYQSKQVCLKCHKIGHIEKNCES